MCSNNQKNFYIFAHSSSPWQQRILFEFLTSIPIEESFKCLDVGCGIGNNLETLLKFFKNITALDISKEALTYAKSRFKKFHIDFVHGNIENLPFKDNTFDVIVCTEVLEHVENIEKARDELLRVIKKNGYFIVSAPNYFNLAGIIKIINWTIGKKNWDVWGDAQRSGMPERFMTYFSLKKLFSREGIIILKEQGADFLNSWFLFLPFVHRNFKILDKYPCILLGKLPFLKKIGMNYFILAQIKSPQ